jgi:hypothetical protein
MRAAVNQQHQQEHNFRSHGDQHQGGQLVSPHENRVQNLSKIGFETASSVMLPDGSASP